jgi:DeoR family transcriptional regulator, aga operon transcriptional repressor
MTPHLQEAELNAQMMRIARQVVVVADSSKLIRRNVSLIAKVEQINILITDDAVPEQAVEALRRRGVDVRLV